MSPLAILFWASATCVAWTYVGYPIVIGLLAARWGRPPRLVAHYRKTVSVLLAAFNEERSIGRRVNEFRRLLVLAGVSGEIIVVSDGSTDRTAEIAAELAEEPVSDGVRVRSLALPTNRGKAIALTEGGRMAVGEVIVLADARQTWADDAIPKLLENFADPEVGAVSGELMLESAPGVLAGVGLYWRFEKWLRNQESRYHSMIGVTGAISATRRELFPPIPEGTILDDVYWPLLVAMGGRRVVFDGRAVAHDRLPDRLRDEFRRKVRTLSGNFQLVQRAPKSLLPGENPIWYALWFHKLFRLVVPWALLVLLFSSFALGGWFYTMAGIVQLAGYSVAATGSNARLAARFKPASAASSFVVLNAAAWVAFWVWITGRTSRAWRKATYQSPASTPDREPSPADATPRPAVTTPVRPS